MLPDVIVHKSNMSVSKGGGGKEKKVFIIGALESKPRPKADGDVMDTLSMVVSIVGRKCSGVADFFRSYYVSWLMVTISPSWGTSRVERW